jgi:hypothetical protein
MFAASNIQFVHFPLGRRSGGRLAEVVVYNSSRVNKNKEEKMWENNGTYNSEISTTALAGIQDTVIPCSGCSANGRSPDSRRASGTR